MESRRFTSVCQSFHSFTRLALAFGLALGLSSAIAVDSPSFYASWVKPWTARPATSEALGGAELKCIVSLITGEADPNIIAGMTPPERLAYAYRIQVAATEITANGACRDYFVSNTSSKSGAVRQLSPADFEKVISELAKLPGDDALLPPAGKRVIVQVRENGQWHVSVYDGRKLPPEVKSLLDQLANPFM